MESFDPGSGVEKFRIWDKHPGYATLDKKVTITFMLFFFCSEILDKAALAEDNYEQMAYVAAFTLSAYRWLRKIINRKNSK
jgi:hypothetical protein